MAGRTIQFTARILLVSGLTLFGINTASAQHTYWQYPLGGYLDGTEIIGPIRQRGNDVTLPLYTVAPVRSVNTQVGSVVITASSLGAALALNGALTNPTITNPTLSAPLSVANGGTGTTSATGTGSVVLSSGAALVSPQITTPTLSAPLSPANGGTGVASVTGTGSAALSTNPTLTGPTIVSAAFSGTNTGGTFSGGDVSAQAYKVMSSAASITVSGRFGQEINIIDYGGDPTNTADSTPAWNAACTAISQEASILHLPAGIYRATSPWVCNGKQMTVKGDGSFNTVIYAYHTGAALTINPSAITQHIAVEGFNVYPASGSPQSVAISITYPTYSSFPYETTLIRDVGIMGGPTPGSTYFTTGLFLSGAWQSRIQGYKYWSPSVSGSPVSGTIGINFARSFDLVIDDAILYSADVGIYQSDYAEGIHIHHADCVSVNVCFENAVAAHPVNTFSGLSLTMDGSECDVLQKCIWLTQYDTGFIDNSRIEMSADSTSYFGIQLSDTRQVHVGYNSFQGTSNTALATGVGVFQSSFGAGAGNRIDGFTCYATAACVLFGAGTSNNVAVNLVSQLPTAAGGQATYGTGFLDSGNQNYMNAITGPGRTMQVGGYSMAGAGNQLLLGVPDVSSAVNYVSVMATTGSISPGISANNVSSAATSLELGGTNGGSSILVAPIGCSAAPTGSLCTGVGSSVASIK